MVSNVWKKNCAPFPSNILITPHDFERHQWQKSKKISILYLIYKWCIAIQFIVVLLFSIFSGERYGKSNVTYWKWFAYLTNWGFTLCTIQAFLSLWIIQWARTKKKTIEDGRKEMPKLYKFYWIFHSLATSVAFTITLMYWALIYNPETNRLDVINILVHGGNSILMFIDLWLVSHPCPLFHVVFAVSAGFIYTVFTYVYYLCGGTDRAGKHYIYEQLNWQHPWKAVIFSLISMGVAAVFHFTAYILSILRRKIAKRYQKKKNQNYEQSLQEKPIFKENA